MVNGGGGWWCFFYVYIYIIYIYIYVCVCDCVCISIYIYIVVVVIGIVQPGIAIAMSCTRPGHGPEMVPTKGSKRWFFGRFQSPVAFFDLMKSWYI